MTAGQITTRLNEQLYYEINSAQVYTFGPPSIPGLGPGSGFTIMIQDKGGNTPGYLADYTDRFIAAARAAARNSDYQHDLSGRRAPEGHLDRQRESAQGRHLARRAALADQLVSRRHVRQ